MKKKVLLPLLLLTIVFIFVGCSKGVLDNGIYIGKTGTIQIIEANSSDEWTIKERNKSDENYIVASVTKTGEKIEEYPVIELKAKQITGDIRDSFTPREGRKYIVDQNNKEIYFVLAGEKGEESRSEKEKDLKEIEDVDKINYMEEHAKFTFKK